MIRFFFMGVSPSFDSAISCCALIMRGKCGTPVSNDGHLWDVWMAAL
jgi:hypothetical protein